MISSLHFYILIVVYMIFGIISGFFEIKNIKKNEKLHIIDFFRIFYLFNYCIVPICSLTMMYTNQTSDMNVFKYLETESILFKYIVMIISILLYIGINKFYSIFSRKKIESRKPIIDCQSIYFYIGNIIIMLVGWGALVLYTYAYGSVIGILEYASSIRDNIFVVENKFTFMQPFTQVLIFSTLNYIILLRNMKDKPKIYKLLTIILSIISIIGSCLVLLITDSRMQMLFQFLIIGYYLCVSFNINIKKLDYKKIIIAIILLFIFFFITVNIDNITLFFREGEVSSKSNNYNIVNFIAREFGFTYVNNLNILDRLINKNNFDLRVDDNIILSLITFLPRRIKTAVTMNMFYYNTTFSGKEIGKIPTDLITGAIYSLKYIGIIAFMVWIPFLITMVERIFKKYKKINDYYVIMFAFLGIFMTFRLVVYYDFSELLFSCFALIISYIILLFCKFIFSQKLWFELSKKNKYIRKIWEYLIDKSCFKWIPDKKFLEFKYMLRIEKELNLDNPKTFNEKLQWLKLYDRNPEYTKMVDKYEVKKYISETIGEEYIIPTIGVWDNFEDINFENLPNQFVLKCTHDSGGIVICKDKKSLDIEQARKKLNKSLKRNYYYVHREWPYKKIKPRIIAEKYMVDESGEELKDYKFFCFNGEPKMLFVAVDRPHDTKFNFYDLEFNKLPFMQHYKNFDRKIEKPKSFDKMIELAKILSNGIPHVRVDFYDINGKTYFGELTFYHFTGFEKFEPEEWDLKIGNMLQLPADNSKEKK